jgi:glycosyltransferase involved in cell wall biosynthesis
VDAVPLQKMHGGVSYHIYYLLDELIRLRPDDSFFLFVEREAGDVAYFKKYPNVTISAYSSCSLGHSIWSQTALAFGCWVKKIDAFWGTTQSIPLIRRRRMKTLITVYDFVYLLYPATVSTYKRIYLQVFSKWMLKSAHFTLPISQGSALKLQQFYSLKSTAIITPPLKPLLHYRENVVSFLRTHSLERKKYLVTIGTFEPRKNFLELIEVYVQLLQKDSSAVLPLVIIGGGGWKNKKLIEMLDRVKRDYPSHFHIVGYAIDDEIAQFLSGPRNCLMLAKYEGYGMPLSESRKCRTPVICMDQIEMREASENDGIFLNSNSWKEQIIPYLLCSSEICCVKELNYPTNRAKAQKLSDLLSKLGNSVSVTG